MVFFHEVIPCYKQTVKLLLNYGCDDLLGSVTVIDELDYDSEARRNYDLTIRATDTQSGAFSETIVHVQLEVGGSLLSYN